jgi:hypothetical protein
MPLEFVDAIVSLSRAIETEPILRAKTFFGSQSIRLIVVRDDATTREEGPLQQSNIPAK